MLINQQKKLRFADQADREEEAPWEGEDREQNLSMPEKL